MPAVNIDHQEGSLGALDQVNGVRHFVEGRISVRTEFTELEHRELMVGVIAEDAPRTRAAIACGGDASHTRRELGRQSPLR